MKSLKYHFSVSLGLSSCLKIMFVHSLGGGWALGFSTVFFENAPCLSGYLLE